VLTHCLQNSYGAPGGHRSPVSDSSSRHHPRSIGACCYPSGGEADGPQNKRSPNTAARAPRTRGAPTTAAAAHGPPCVVKCYFVKATLKTDNAFTIKQIKWEGKVSPVISWRMFKVLPACPPFVRIDTETQDENRNQHLYFMWHQAHADISPKFLRFIIGSIWRNQFQELSISYCVQRIWTNEHPRVWPNI